MSEEVAMAISGHEAEICLIVLDEVGVGTDEEYRFVVRILDTFPNLEHAYGHMRVRQK